MSQQVFRYSEAFKMKVISELESGQFSGVSEARRHYGIRGGSTIQYWLKKYGKNHLRSKVIKVNTPDDRDEVKELRKRIKELEKTLADTQVQSVLNDAYYKVVCEKHGINNPEDYKKKLDSML
jgi:transposase-like protein